MGCITTVRPLGIVETETRFSTVSQDEAALRIQKIFKGFITRKDYLPHELFPSYNDACFRVLSGLPTPRAINGNTPVYFPEKAPEVVLKRSGEKKAKERFSQMHDVRKILREQGSSHLVIPRAALCGRFLAEDRLPIDPCSFFNMATYLENLPLFDAPVREFVRLFSRVVIEDLVDSHQTHPPGKIAGVDNVVRYDNMPLFIVEEKGKKIGKVALIDLERLKKKPSPTALLMSLETLARIFPYHGNIIEEEAKKLGICVIKGNMQRASERGKKYLEMGYSAHLEWLREKEITCESAMQVFEIDEKKIKNLSTGFIRGDFLSISSAIVIQVTSIIINFIRQTLQEYHDQHRSTEFKSELELVQLRSPVIDRENLLKIVIDHLGRDQRVILRHPVLEKLALYLIEGALVELVKSEKIFMFDPTITHSTKGFFWIRY